MRKKPIRLPLSLYLPSGEVREGELQVHARPGATDHPIGGYVFVGENSIPLIGTLHGLRIVHGPEKKRGRPPKPARDMGVFLAYQSIFMCARPADGSAPTIRGRRALAMARVLDLWQRWPGIQDERGVRRVIKKAEGELTGSPGALLTYSGTAADCSDYAAILLLRGAVVAVRSGALRASGPAWVWHWGSERASRHELAQVTADAPDAKDFETQIGQ